ESPTAATIFCAAAALETSKATISRWRGALRRSGDDPALRGLGPPCAEKVGRADIPPSLRLLRELCYRGTVVGNGLVAGLRLRGVNQVQTHTLQALLLVS